MNRPMFTDWFNLYSAFFSDEAMYDGIYNSISIMDRKPWSFNSQFVEATGDYTSFVASNNVFYVGTLLAVDTTSGDYKQLTLKAASGVLNTICDGRSLQIFDQVADPATGEFGANLSFPLQFFGLKYIAPGIQNLPVPAGSPLPPTPGALVAGFFLSGMGVTGSSGVENSGVFQTLADTFVFNRAAFFGAFDAAPGWTFARIVNGANVTAAFEGVPGTPLLIGGFFDEYSGSQVELQVSVSGVGGWTTVPESVYIQPTVDATADLLYGPEAGFFSPILVSLAAGVATIHAAFDDDPGALHGFPTTKFGTCASVLVRQDDQASFWTQDGSTYNTFDAVAGDLSGVGNQDPTGPVSAPGDSLVLTAAAAASGALYHSGVDLEVLIGAFDLGAVSSVIDGTYLPTLAIVP